MTTVDSSVLIAALSTWHVAHKAAADVVKREGLRVGGHVLLETYAVLTGGALQHRVRPELAVRALAAFAPPLTLSPEGHLATVRRCTSSGVQGGAVYDALVAATAAEAGASLISRDRRAARIYEIIGVAYDLIA